VDRVRDPGRIVVQGKSIVYSKLLHEGECVKGETQGRLGRAFWSQQDICKDERVILLMWS
jgi:hypothetical protein